MLRWWRASVNTEVEAEEGGKGHGVEEGEERCIIDMNSCN